MEVAPVHRIFQPLFVVLLTFHVKQSLIKHPSRPDTAVTSLTSHIAICTHIRVCPYEIPRHFLGCRHYLITVQRNILSLCRHTICYSRQQHHNKSLSHNSQSCDTKLAFFSKRTKFFPYQPCEP